MKNSVGKQVSEVNELSAVIQPYLYGRKPEIQGAVLADLLSIFLAGHMLVDKISGEVDRVATDQMRETLLAQHLDGMRDMLRINEVMLLERMKERAS
jgi:hypothetical protein